MIEYSVFASKFSIFRIGTADFVINPVVLNNYIYIYIKYIVYEHFRVAEHSGVVIKRWACVLRGTGELRDA